MSKKFVLFIFLFLILTLSPLISSELLQELDDDDLSSLFNKIITDDNFFKTYDFKSVLFYDEDSITSGIKNNQPLLLFVYASYHHYSQKSVPEFLQVVEYFEKNKSKFDFTMNFGRINGADNRRFSMIHNIRQYPKILLFYKNKEYILNRDVYYKNDILRFVRKKIFGEINEIDNLKDLDELINNKDLNDRIFLLSTIVDKENNSSKVFEEYTNNNEKINYIHCSSKECIDKFKVHSKNNLGEDIYIIKNFDEKINSFSSFSDSVDITNLENFILLYGVESGALLDNKNYFSLAETHKKKIIIYYRDTKNSLQKKFDQVIKEVGIDLRSKNYFVFVSDIEGSEIISEIAESFVVSQQELPCIIIQDLKKEKNQIDKNDNRKMYYENIEEDEELPAYTYRLTKLNLKEFYKKENVLKFVNDVENNKIKRDLVSQYLPNEEFVDVQAPFKIIVGRNFDKEVIENKKNVLLTLVNRKTPCEMCKKYLKVVRGLGEKNNHNGKNNLEFVVMDGASNEPRDLTYKIDDLPLMYIYVNDNNKNKDKKVVKFIENKDICEEGVVKFLKDNLGEYHYESNKGDL